MKIPRTHPRFESLRIRESLVKGVRSGIVVPEGLIAHGRGEAFDYILGERTLSTARRATRAAAAQLLRAQTPVVSVNGNTAALVPREIVRLASLVAAKLEVNLFHRTREREVTIARLLRRYGAREVLGVGSKASMRIRGISSPRVRADPSGIGRADVVLVPLEDGDRASALQNLGKTVIAIDLNPLSRTSQVASVTIVDNVVRALPALIEQARTLRHRPPSEFDKIITDFNNRQNLTSTLVEMTRYLEGWSRNCWKKIAWS